MTRTYGVIIYTVMYIYTRMMDDGTYQAKHPVKSVRNTVAILETLKEQGGATLTELATELDQSKSSIHNYLSTLLEQECIVKEGDKYFVGLRMLTLGSATRNREKVFREGRQEIDRLAEETGELANLFVEEHGRGVYIYRKSGHRAVSVDAYIGQRVHLHNTALGKVILANLPRSQVDQIIRRHGLPKTSENTITDREELYDQLEEVEANGIAFDDEERINGLRCVAVPILNDQDEVEGAISISGPTTRMAGDRFRSEIPELLQSAANIIELNITYD